MLSLSIRVATLLLFLATCSARVSADPVGDEGDNRLVGSPGFDVYYGGEGADTFVIEHLPQRPDWILDFEPEKGDLIEFVAADLGLEPLTRSNFSLSRRGVLSLKLGAQNIPLVHLGSGEFRIELDSRKGSYFLKFDRKLGQR